MEHALRAAKFDFTAHDVYTYDREHASRPANLTEAHALWQQQLRADYLEEKLGDKPGDKPGKRAAEIAKTLAHRYAQQLRTMKGLKSDEVLGVYLDALAHVYDPHSDYMGHEETESFAIAMNLSLFGIGATLETSDGYCTIRGLVPGGPAARSGQLKPGDRIVAVAQAGKEPVYIKDMPLTRTVELIRGAKGSIVTLTIAPAGAADGAATRTVSIVRDQVKLADQEAKASIVDMPTATGGTLRLGVIDLPSFYAAMDGAGAAPPRSATADVARLLHKLEREHVQGVMLDLRHNGGGSLAEAISLTGLFIRTGPVVQTRDRAGHVEVGADTDPAVAYDGPLVLLTSRFSASATEILAGALQDYGRAVVVGDTSTFGKGTVQNIMPLAPIMDRFRLAHAYDPGVLKVTISKFYRPSGASTQLRGVARRCRAPIDDRCQRDRGVVAEESAALGHGPVRELPAPRPGRALRRRAPRKARAPDRGRQGRRLPDRRYRTARQAPRDQVDLAQRGRAPAGARRRQGARRRARPGRPDPRREPSDDLRDHAGERILAGLAAAGRDPEGSPEGSPERGRGARRECQDAVVGLRSGAGRAQRRRHRARRGRARPGRLRRPARACPGERRDRPVMPARPDLR